VGGSRGCSGRDRAFADRRGQMTLPDSGLKSKGCARVKPVLRVCGVLGVFVTQSRLWGNESGPRRACFAKAQMITYFSVVRH